MRKDFGDVMDVVVWAARCLAGLFGSNGTVGDQVLVRFALMASFGQRTHAALGRDVTGKFAAVVTSAKNHESNVNNTTKDTTYDANFTFITTKDTSYD